MPVDPRFTTRAYRPGDEQAILDLFNRSFPHSPRSLEHFRWKYRDNPFGGGRISLTWGAAVPAAPAARPAPPEAPGGTPGADERDARPPLVAHYSGYPVPFVFDKKHVLAHQIGDTMTEPSIRHIGRGPTSILGRTALHFYEHFCEGQVAFNYGFNVANIQRFSLKFLRSDRVEPVTYRVCPPLPPIARGERWLRGYRLELVSETGADFDDLFARAAPSYRFLVRRDARYLRWRYLDCPDVPYFIVAIRKWRQLVGWIVFRIRDTRFVLGDLLVHPMFPDALEVALRHVVPLHPVDVIETWLPPRPQWLDRALAGLGFETRPEPQDLSVMCVSFQWPDATARMREALYYTWGDSDLF